MWYPDTFIFIIGCCRAKKKKKHCFAKVLIVKVCHRVTNCLRTYTFSPCTFHFITWVPWESSTYLFVLREQGADAIWTYWCTAGLEICICGVTTAALILLHRGILPLCFYLHHLGCWTWKCTLWWARILQTAFLLTGFPTQIKPCWLSSWAFLFRSEPLHQKPWTLSVCYCGLVNAHLQSHKVWTKNPLLTSAVVSSSELSDSHSSTSFIRPLHLDFHLFTSRFNQNLVLPCSRTGSHLFYISVLTFNLFSGHCILVMPLTWGKSRMGRREAFYLSVFTCCYCEKLYAAICVVRVLSDYLSSHLFFKKMIY